MGPSIDIVFNKKDPVFKAGEIVTGQVRIKTNENLTLRGINARYRGKAHTKWYDIAEKGYYGKEQYYLKIDEKIWPSGKSQDGTHVLSAGSHEIPFKFEIPRDTASTMEDSSDIGWVRYTVAINLDRPSAFDYKATKALTVVAEKDLNLDPEAKHAPTKEVVEKVGFFPRRPVKVTISADKGGYVPGEQIHLTVDVDNGTDKDIKSIKCLFKQKLKFEGSDLYTIHKKVEHTLVEYKETLNTSEKQLHWETKLRVPSVPPSEPAKSSIIEIWYTLRVMVSIGGSIDVKVPIVVGTIPLKGGQHKTDQPPTYVESFFGTVHVKEEDDDKDEAGITFDYTPFYPAYPFDN